MKKLVLFIGVVIMLVAAHVAFSQTQEGVITYEIRINNHRALPAGEEGRKAMIPEFRTFKEQVFFNAGESICKPLIEEEEDEDMNGGRRRRFQPRMVTYSKVGADVVLTQQDMMGKNYLIEDSVKVSPWKFGTEIKPVQGYDCKQAYYTEVTTVTFNGETKERKQVITAWYTDKLRPFLGPDRYNTLPGAVLAIDVNNGERVLVATKLELRPLKKNELKEPTEGTKMTQPEFRKMMEEQFKNRRGGMIFRN